MTTKNVSKHCPVSPGVRGRVGGVDEITPGWNYSAISPGELAQSLAQLEVLRVHLVELNSDRFNEGSLRMSTTLTHTCDYTGGGGGGSQYSTGETMPFFKSSESFISVSKEADPSRLLGYSEH